MNRIANASSGQRLTAVILAGSRPGGDPLLDGTGLSTKALLSVAGRPMLAWVLDAVTTHRAVSRVIILAQQPDLLAPVLDAARAATAVPIETARSDDGISASLLGLIDGRIDYPILLTTADNVLIQPAMIDAVIAGGHGADISVAMVERRVLAAAYPGNRRTWLRFRGGVWSGANLFLVGSAAARPAIAFWRGIEHDRKKGRKIIGAFGPVLLLGAALRLFSLPQALAMAGRKLGVRARLVPMPFAEACIDADKPDDVALIEAILVQRAGS